MHQQV